MKRDFNQAKPCSKIFKTNYIAGFTLIELLVVMVIISIITVVSMASIVKSQKRSRDTRRKIDITAIQSALESYYNQNKEYPESGTETETNCGNATGWSCDYAAANVNTIWMTGLAGYADKLGKDPLGTTVSPSVAGATGGPVNAAARSQHYYGYYSATANVSPLCSTAPPATCAYRTSCNAEYTMKKYYVLAAILENTSDLDAVKNAPTNQYYLNCVEMKTNDSTYNENGYIKIRAF